MFFEPKNPDGTRKKVTNVECWIRFGLMIGPIIIPYIYFEDEQSTMWGTLWLIVMGPFWLSLVSASDDEWEEGTEWFKWVCKNVGRFYLGLLFFSFLLYLVAGGGYR